MSTSAHPFRRQLRAAELYLSAASPVFATIIDRVGPCTLTPNPDVFRVLVGSLISQFISTAAASAIQGRLEARLKGTVTPRRVLNLSDDDLKACGISGGKAKSIRGVAEHFARSRRFTDKLIAADDHSARAMLLPLYGVGPWTVDMLLIFSIFRLDVWPVGDFGVRAAVRDLHGLDSLPGPKQMELIAEPWRPYRSIAAWYLWRTRDLTPRSKAAEASEDNFPSPRDTGPTNTSCKVKRSRTTGQ